MGQKFQSRVLRQPSNKNVFLLNIMNLFIFASNYIAHSMNRNINTKVIFANLKNQLITFLSVGLTEVEVYQNLNLLLLKYDVFLCSLFWFFYHNFWSNIIKQLNMYKVLIFSWYCHNLGQSKVKLSNLEWYYYRKVPLPPPLPLPPRVSHQYRAILCILPQSRAEQSRDV